MEDQQKEAALEQSTVGVVGVFLLELLKVAILAGVTIFLVRHFLFKPFYVKGQSMEPSFLSSEYLIIDELSYRLREPVRGEVVVFKEPLGSQKDFYLKRIIGLPGERVKLEDNTIIIYNEEHPKGFVLIEDYLTEATPGSKHVELGDDQYFVLGDNRDASFDSRRFGPIKQNMIVGRAWLRGWPFSRFSFLDAPVYNTPE